MDENQSSPARPSPGFFQSLDSLRLVSCLALACLGLYAILVLGLKLWHEVGGLRRELAVARAAEPMGYVGISSDHPDWKPESCIRESDGHVYLWAGTGTKGQAGWFDVTNTDLPLRQFRFAFGRDKIKTIDYPIFQDPSDEIARRIYPERLVIGVEIDGVARAYPLTVMEKVEVVNESFGDRSVAVTYCPLLQEAAIFERSLKGHEVSLGNSGYCYLDAFVLYDRDTDSLWHPVEGGLAAITGPLAGNMLPVVDRPKLVPWGEWQRLHPDTAVLVGADRSRGIPLIRLASDP